MGTEQLCAPLQAGHCACPPGQTSLSLQTGLVGENRLPLWGHEILRLEVDTGPVPAQTANSSSFHQGQQSITLYPGFQSSSVDSPWHSPEEAGPRGI